MTVRRRELNLSQRELAQIADLPLGTVAALESGRMVSAPRPRTLEKLAIGLKTSYLHLDSLVRGLDPGEIEHQVRWQEEYYYRMFDALMQSDRIPEAEKAMFLAKLRTLWQTHGDREIAY